MCAVSGHLISTSPSSPIIPSGLAVSLRLSDAGSRPTSLNLGVFQELVGRSRLRFFSRPHGMAERCSHLSARQLTFLQ